MNFIHRSRFAARKIIAGALAPALFGLSLYPEAAHARIPSHIGWQLVWSDDFKGKRGSLPNTKKWTLQTGGTGWGNDELEYYTARPVNVHREHGNLIITALRETFTGADGVQKPYTSARLETSGKFEQAYGRFEARIRIPRGQGIWPAFWLLGANEDSVHWPQCGEIDIMENIGKEPAQVHGSMHGPGYSGGHPLTSAYTLPGNSSVADSFHTFAVEWEPGTVRFFVDDQLSRDANRRGPARRDGMGLRSSVLHPAQSRGGRQVAR